MSTKLPEILRERALVARRTETLIKAREWVVSAAPYIVLPLAGRAFSQKRDAPRKRVASLHGPTGGGKSIAASWCALLVEANPLHYGPKGIGYYHAREIASCAEWKTDVWEAFDTWSIVIIDDVGTERDAARCADVIERCFNHRYGPTILTTNLTARELLARYGARVDSRIRGEGRAINTAAVDMRLEAPETEEYAKPHDRPWGSCGSDGFLTAEEAEAYRAELELQREERAQREREEMESWQMRRQAAEIIGDTTEQRTLRPVPCFDESKRKAELDAQLEQLRRAAGDAPKEPQR